MFSLRYISHTESIPHAVPATDPVNITGKIIDAIANGNGDEAARALITLVPDANELIRSYGVLIETASQSQGKINVSILKQACTGYHGWHAVEINDAERGTAIIQWIGQKLWEMPAGSDKERFARLFINDIDRLIDNGKLPARKGLQVAYHSIMWWGIRPGVSAQPLIRLLVKQSTKGDDDEVRAYIFTTFVEMAKLIDPKDVTLDELFHTIKSAFPEKKYPACSAEEYLIPSYLPHVIPMTWSEYEAMPTLTYEQLHSAIEKKQCHYSNVGPYGTTAAELIVDKYRSDPDEIEKLVTSLFQEDLFASFLATRLIIQADSVSAITANERLAQLLLDHFEQNIIKGDRRAFCEAIDYSWELLCKYSKVITNQPSSKPVTSLQNETSVPRKVCDLEMRLVAILLDAGIQWEKRVLVDPQQATYAESPLVQFSKSRKIFSTEIAQYIQTKANDLLTQKSAGYRDLPADSQKKIRDQLNILTNIS